MGLSSGQDDDNLICNSMKVPRQGTRRSGQGVAVPAVGTPSNKRFDPPKYPWQHGYTGTPSAAVDTTVSRRMQTTYSEDEPDDDQGIPGDHVLRESIRMILRESYADDILHLGLDVCGLIPGVGEVCDLGNVILYCRKGEWLNAAFSLISTIPELGDLIGKGGKLAVWIEKSSPKLAHFLTTYGPKIKKIKTLIRDNRDLIEAIFEKVEDSELVRPYIEKLKDALRQFTTGKPDSEISEVSTVASGAISGWTEPLGASYNVSRKSKSKVKKRRQKK